MKEWPTEARAVLLVGCACILFLALAEFATRDDPYAPNGWLFSHSFLAERAVEDERIPFNRDILTDNGFAESHASFQEEVGLTRLTFYATTVWHFWNGLPVQPALLASLAALTGGTPEEAARAPLGGLVVLLLVFAAADLLVGSRGSAPEFDEATDASTGNPAPLAALAPFALVLGSAPLVLDMRVLMPGASLVIVALLFLLLLRRQLERDTRALAYAMIPLALLPFWYYTISYFVIVLFGGFFLWAVAARWRSPESPAPVPVLVALAVPAALGGALLLNGALTSHLTMAATMGTTSLLGGEVGGDYATRLNREPWRSALLYATLGLLFVPLALVAMRSAWRAAAGKRVAPAGATFASWCVGGGVFSLALPALLGASFLNRSAIYLAPLAAVALAWFASRSRLGRRLAVAALVVGAAATPAIVATAAPSYSQGDAHAFLWMEESVPRDAVMYSSLDVASVLFREHGFHDTLAFHPRSRLLEDFWYGDDPEKLVPYLQSIEWVVLRDDVRTHGFEEFGPLRQPISGPAFDKFDNSRDLHRVYDNGEVRVYRVVLAPDRFADVGG